MDKVQKIREWVKARLDENTSKQSLPQFYGMMEEDARFLDFLNSLQKESVSEDLKRAFDNALESILDQYDIISVGSCLEMFGLGAQWQKEQMMAKAINTKASLMMSVPSICISLPLGVNVGDKVKVIVIKEE